MPKARIKYKEDGSLEIEKGDYFVILGKLEVSHLLDVLLIPKENPCTCGNPGGTGEWCNC